jgi:hypothetical protein
MSGDDEIRIVQDDEEPKAAAPEASTRPGAEPGPGEKEESTGARGEGSILLYPLRNHGAILIFGALALYFVFYLFTTVILLWPFFASRFLLDLYLLAFCVKVIRSSADGLGEPPDLPLPGELYFELARPVALSVPAVALTFGPPVFMVQHGLPPFHPLVFVYVLLFLLYFPMQVVAVSITESLSTLNPAFVIGAAVTLWRSYLPRVLLIGAVGAGLGFLLGGLWEKQPLTAWILAHAGGIYLFVLFSRLLGRMYYCNREKLGWFEKT